jgi:hypothetical protein
MCLVLLCGMLRQEEAPRKSIGTGPQLHSPASCLRGTSMVRIVRPLSLKTLTRTATAPARGLLLLCGLGTVAATPGARGDAAAHHAYRPRDLYKAPPPNLVLKQVIVVVRHGDRAPIARVSYACATLMRIGHNAIIFPQAYLSQSL